MIQCYKSVLIVVSTINVAYIRAQPANRTQPHVHRDLGGIAIRLLPRASCQGGGRARNHRSISNPCTMRVSFSGAGFLGAWHLGVCDALVQAGVHHRMSVAGASAGALVGAILVSGASVPIAREHLRKMAASTREQPLGILTPGLDLVEMLRNALSEDLPPDAHVNASGRLHVALTSLRAGELGKVWHQSHFASRDELIAAVTSSSDIPGLTGRVRGTPLAVAEAEAMAVSAAEDRQQATANSGPPTGLLLQHWLRRRDVDGGLLDLFPDPWADDMDGPPTIFVSPFSGVGLHVAPPRVDGALAMPEWSPIAAGKKGRGVDLTPTNVKRWRDALLPPSGEALREYEDAGYANAMGFLERHAAAAEEARSDS